MSPEKLPTNEEIKKFNNPVHEAIDRKGLSIKDHTIIEQNLDLDDEKNRLTKNDPEKKFIPIQEIPDGIDWEEYIIDMIDNPKTYSINARQKRQADKVADKVKAKAIIRKYSMPREEWNKLNKKEKRNVIHTIQKEIQELYIAKPRRMVRKKVKSDSEEIEKNADVTA